MKQILFGLLWLAAFAAAGAGLGRHFIPLYFPDRTAIGAVLGLLLFFPLAGVGWLPGAARRRDAAVEWGWKQAVWITVQFFTMQVFAQFVFVLAVAVVRLVAQRTGHPQPALDLMNLQTSMGSTLVFATAAGYLAAAWWSVWYVGRLGPARLADGGPAGVAWRAAPFKGYLAALGCLVVVGAAGVLIEHLLPPAKGAQDGLIQQIFGGAGWKVAALFLLAAVVAPFLEEFVFRGGMMAALSPRLGVFWGAAVTALVFTMCHVEETWEYHAGLLVILVIAVLLAWLRLTYQSIRPGILLHVLFNGISVLALAFAH